MINSLYKVSKRRKVRMMVREKMDYRDVATDLLRQLKESNYRIGDGRYYFGDDRGRETTKPEFDKDRAVLRMFPGQPENSWISNLMMFFFPKIPVGVLNLSKDGVGLMDVCSPRDFSDLYQFASKIGKTYGFYMETGYANPIRSIDPKTLDEAAIY